MSLFFLLLAMAVLVLLLNTTLGHLGVGERAWPPPVPAGQGIGRLFSFRHVVGYLAAFGFAGWLGEGLELGKFQTLLVATLGGAVLLWLGIRLAAMREGTNTTFHGRMADALGQEVRVTQGIAPQRTGRGKVLASLRHGQQEFPAVTDATQAIPAQARVVVTGLVRGALVVMPRH